MQMIYVMEAFNRTFGMMIFLNLLDRPKFGSPHDKRCLDTCTRIVSVFFDTV